MALETSPFDPADYLTDTEAIAEYLALSFEEEDPRIISKALNTVARALGGIEMLARDTGIEPEVLERALNEDSNPDIGTVLKIMHRFGVHLRASSRGLEPAA